MLRWTRYGRPSGSLVGRAGDTRDHGHRPPTIATQSGSLESPPRCRCRSPTRARPIPSPRSAVKGTRPETFFL
eukprot:scaffold227622_cov18-Tisochrysis_lutea.AAC.1